MSRPKNIHWILSWPQEQTIKAQKSKKLPQIKSNLKVRNEGIIENESCSTVWVDPKIVFEPYPDSNNSQLGPQKVKSDTNIKSKSKVTIEENIENKICSTNRVNPKPTWPKIAHHGSWVKY